MSRITRMKTENLALVSKHETERQKFSILSRSTRSKDRNSRSRLEARDWKTEILDHVSKHETERKKFSILSRELKNASRYALSAGGEKKSKSTKRSPGGNGGVFDKSVVAGWWSINSPIRFLLAATRGFIKTVFSQHLFSIFKLNSKQSIKKVFLKRY